MTKFIFENKERTPFKGLPRDRQELIVLSLRFRENIVHFLQPDREWGVDGCESAYDESIYRVLAPKKTIDDLLDEALQEVSERNDFASEIVELHKNHPVEFKEKVANVRYVELDTVRVMLTTFANAVKELQND